MGKLLLVEAEFLPQEFQISGKGVPAAHCRDFDNLKRKQPRSILYKRHANLIHPNVAERSRGRTATGFRMAIADDNAESQNGLTDLYRRHRAWLASRVSRAGALEPEDVVQEAFLRASSYGAGSSIKHPRALLLKIALNVARAAARSAQAAKNTAPPFEALTGGGAVGADQFEAVLVKQIVLALPEDYRDIFVMHRFGGMSYEEIAQARGMTVKAVEWRMSRALSICAATLRE
jgi:RNA polymerase sigma-70 factor (ECF subfamily)